MPESEVLVAVKDSSGILSHHLLRQGRNTVGRGDDRDVIVAADGPSEVSKEHLSIYVGSELDDGLTVIDERTKPINLTYINGYSIELGREIQLRLTDTISMGKKGYRLHITQPDITMSGPFEEIAVKNDEVLVNGRPIDTNASQKLATKLLMASKGKTLSYGYIYSEITKRSANNKVNSKFYCQRLIGQLRKLIGERYPGFLIETIEGEGYQFRNPGLRWTTLK